MKIVKKDENSNAKLANVKFKIKRSSDGKFINKSSTGDITYVDENNATEFYTNINGEILKCTSISNEYNQGDCVKICVDRDNIVFFPL